jgi:hypothetical protein
VSSRKIAELTDFNIHCEFNEGIDWKDNFVLVENSEDWSIFPESNDSDSSSLLDTGLEIVSHPKKTVKVNLSNLNLTVCKPREEKDTVYRWISDIWIEQIEATNEQNHIVSKLDMESSPKFLSLKMSCVKPYEKGSDEYRLKVSICPLRLILEQEILLFLGTFFPSPELASGSDQLYIQFIEIDNIRLRVDYKPKIVSSNAVCADVINSIRILDVPLLLPRVKEGGLQGVSKALDSILSVWKPSIMKDQGLNLLLGLGPLRSAYNVGKGVSDLVLLPIQQYREDGQILVGIKQGAKSLLQKSGLEALKLCSTLAVASEYILQGTSDLVQSNQSMSKFIASQFVTGHQQHRHQGNHSYVLFRPLIGATKRIDLFCRKLQQQIGQGMEEEEGGEEELDEESL